MRVGWAGLGPLSLLLLLLVSPAALAQQRDAAVDRVIQGAYAQLGVTLIYDPSYRVIGFPNGDVSRYRGVCSDVIIRAYRNAGIDLQLLVNRDMRQAFNAYPKLWGLSHPDPNIDHRRVPNLAVFFTRHGRKLPLSSDPLDYHPGDIVTWRLPSGSDHIGLVIDLMRDGRPLIIHNIGWGTQIEDVLFAFEMTGHYRFQPGHV